MSGFLSDGTMTVVSFVALTMLSQAFTIELSHDCEQMVSLFAWVKLSQGATLSVSALTCVAFFPAHIARSYSHFLLCHAWL